jgi:hypothetical protein
MESTFYDVRNRAAISDWVIPFFLTPPFLLRDGLGGAKQDSS